MQRVPDMPPSTGPAENLPEDIEWERDLAEHARTSSGNFSFGNLVPRTDPTLWQHAPHIPFKKLQSQTAVSRLSLCTLDNCLKEARIEDGRPVYASQRGDTNFWRRNPQQISGTLAFMLARDEGREFQLRAEEVPHVRTCLRWLRSKNPHFKVFWANVERFGMLYDALKAVVPQGDLRTPIRISRNKPVEGAVASVVGDTMQSEDAVLVVLDPGEFPASWAVVDHFAESIGSMSFRPAEGGQESDLPLDASLSTNVQQTADALRTQAFAKLSDPHLDAKVFPHLHPWGSGSLHSTEGSGGMHHFARNRLLSFDRQFRQSSVWSFWMLDRLIKNDLYFRQLKRQSIQTVPEDPATTTAATKNKQTKRTALEAGFEHDAREDVYGKLFGRVEPREVPESGAWWRQRQAELMAISEPHELDIFAGMVTITQNDSSPELLANARRGPCASPTEEEMVEHLFVHRRAQHERKSNITKDATAAVLSFQRRTHAIKSSFLRQHHRGPLGTVTDYWDRTEAQTRHALHSHIPFWTKRRKLQHPAVRERLQTQERGERNQPMTTEHEDYIYQSLDIARVLGQLVRPLEELINPSDRHLLLWAFLLRCIQTQGYIHSCTLAYCMRNRATCRFFFPWPECST